jgi:hypothetical protein
MSSRYKIESFYRTLFVEGLPSSLVGGTYTVTKLPRLSEGFLTVEPNTEREEIVYFNGKNTVNSTITITHRAVSPTANSLTTDGTDFGVSGLTFAHPPMCVASADINNLHINVGTISYANAAARDAAEPTPADGRSCYLIAEGYFTDRAGGAWVTRSTGAVGNASETLSGKVQQATLAQQGTATETGSTGAPLFLSPKNTTKTVATSASENKVPVLNSNGKINNFIDSALLSSDILTQLNASQAEAEAATIDTKFVTPYDLSLREEAKVQAVSLSQTSASLTANSWGKPTFSTESFDTNAMHSASSAIIDIKKSGYYRVSGQADVPVTNTRWL